MEDSEIMQKQIEHRRKLISFWRIREGEKILEIGCGQGETTRSLAEATGPTGFVHGIDIASPDYGAPVNLGQARDSLMNSHVGAWIQMDFERDILFEDVDFGEGAFDTVVMSHCAWYFISEKQLLLTLSKLARWGKRLCFAEWDARIRCQEQWAHYQAAMIQAECACFADNDQMNIRTLFTPMDFRRLASRAGWEIVDEAVVSSPLLDDGYWESQMAIDIAVPQNTPEKMGNLINAKIDLLKDYLKTNTAYSMNVFAFIAQVK